MLCCSNSPNRTGNLTVIYWFSQVNRLRKYNINPPKLVLKSHSYEKVIQATIIEINKVSHTHTHIQIPSRCSLPWNWLQSNFSGTFSFSGILPDLNFPHYSSVDFATKVRSRPIYLLFAIYSTSLSRQKVVSDLANSGAIRFAISSFRSKPDKRSLPLSIKAATI